MKTRRYYIAVLLPFLVLAAPAGAKQTSIDHLQRFFKQVKTFNASFDQVVLDEALNPVQESSGRLWIQRPGKFRWDYIQPYEQHIISNGKKIWVYDVELQQATVRKMNGALGQTPAILLAGKGRLADNFKVSDLGKQGSLQWVQMIPKNNDGGYEIIRIGFENKALRMLEMVDGFGQTTRVTLSKARENKKIKTKKFSFTPPEGVDIVE